jgi:hypothetical protein
MAQYDETIDITTKSGLRRYHAFATLGAISQFGAKAFAISLNDGTILAGTPARIYQMVESKGISLGHLAAGLAKSGKFIEAEAHDDLEVTLLIFEGADRLAITNALRDAYINLSEQ